MKKVVNAYVFSPCFFFFSMDSRIFFLFFCLKNNSRDGCMRFFFQSEDRFCLCFNEFFSLFERSVKIVVRDDTLGLVLLTYSSWSMFSFF